MFAEGAMTSPVARLLHPWRLRWLGTVAAATILLVGAIIIGIGVGTVSIPLTPYRAVRWLVAWPSSRKAQRALRTSRFGNLWFSVDGHIGACGTLSTPTWEGGSSRTVVAEPSSALLGQGSTGNCG
jgi:hypothetical protein